MSARSAVHPEYSEINLLVFSMSSEGRESEEA
jgi:hypothetical protein